MKTDWYKSGAVTLVFLILVWQIAVFAHKAAVETVVAHRDRPDTVFVCPVSCGDSRETAGSSTEENRAASVQKRTAPHSDTARAIYSKATPRRYESFRFNPNTISEDELERLGFSPKQAASIIRYREAGGRFRRKSDFAKSFVVADSVYSRLESFIDIPLIDINKADSAAFDELPGIGPYFAAKMVEYREEIGGYVCKEQLMDIWHFDKERYDGLEDLICCTPSERSYDIWRLPLDSLRALPYIRNYQTARAIILFRENTPEQQWSIRALKDAGIITGETAVQLERLGL